MLKHNCGDSDRTIYYINGIFRIGCFKGTYEDAIEMINNDYKGGIRDKYLNDLEVCMNTTIDGALSIADAYDLIYLAEYATGELAIKAIDKRLADKSSKHHLLYLAEYASEKEVVIKVSNRLMELDSTNYMLRYIIRYASEKEVVIKASNKLLDSTPTYTDLKHIVRYAKNKNIVAKAKGLLDA